MFPSCATTCRPLASAAGDSMRPQRTSAPSGRRLLLPGRALSGTATAPASVAAEAYDEPVHESIRPLSRYRALLLDASYRPVGVANWQRAICLDLMEKAEVLEYYEDASVRTVALEYFLPAVLRVRRSRPYKHGRVALNRHNILLRDGFACQYCGSARELTLDHVVPQSRGGPNSWENLVACCSPCNSKKGDKSLAQLRWKLRHHPKEPSPHEMEFLLSTVLGGSAATLDSLPTQWTNYIVPFASKSSRKAKQEAREAGQDAAEMAG